jgi:CRP-like cAMP-binding protein
MYEAYFQHFNKKVPLSEDERAVIKEHLSIKKLRKKQYLLQDGDVCKTIAFIEKGVLRSYTVDENGIEHIMQFAPEGWFISDLYSFLTGQAATYNIDAIEDAELVLIGKSSYEELLQKSPKFESYIRQLITGAYIALRID